MPRRSAARKEPVAAWHTQVRTRIRPRRVAHGERRPHALRGDHGGGRARGDAASRMAARAACPRRPRTWRTRSGSAIPPSTFRTTAAGAISKRAASIAGRRSPPPCPPIAPSGRARGSISRSRACCTMPARAPRGATSTRRPGRRSRARRGSPWRDFASSPRARSRRAPTRRCAPTRARWRDSTRPRSPRDSRWPRTIRSSASTDAPRCCVASACVAAATPAVFGTPARLGHLYDYLPPMRATARSAPDSCWRRCCARWGPSGRRGSCSTAWRSATAGGIRRRAPRIPAIPPMATCRSTSSRSGSRIRCWSRSKRRGSR